MSMSTGLYIVEYGIYMCSSHTNELVRSIVCVNYTLQYYEPQFEEYKLHITANEPHIGLHIKTILSI